MAKAWRRIIGLPWIRPGSVPLREEAGEIRDLPGSARAPPGLKKKEMTKIMQTMTTHRPALRQPLPTARPMPAGTLTEAEIRQIIQEMLG
ncbi:hypothetical protein SAMN02745194_00536 [Roseomonas rosea]|uniref:Uncharacterized protein n=1 Tax=Muricoccus roseus TaxID=198092 RepID=A0A1M6C051_9PROT|nr:hypothetical protein SAMN02745194_00536 [Roseomonas rosea]